MPRAGWAAAEFGPVDLGDTRRTARLITIAEQWGAQPTASIPAASGSWAASKGTYRFRDNAAVDPDRVLAAHAAATAARAGRERVVLALQDTTQLEFTGHPALEGAGPLAGTRQRGIFVHTVLAVTDAAADDAVAVPLGVVHQERWARDAESPGRHTRRQRGTAEKESQRWLTALEQTQARLGATRTVITVADREADLYALFALRRPIGRELLIRATQNRRVTDPAGYLVDAVEAAPVIGTHPVMIGRRDGRPPRTAELELRTLATELLPPHRERGQPIPVVVILATEVGAPGDPRFAAPGATAGLPAVRQRDRRAGPADPIEPIRWLLVTTVLDHHRAGAIAAIRRYAQRWLIERYHYVLKQGGRVEALQLRTVDRLERAVAIWTVVAWRLLWLTYQARATPDAPGTVVLPEAAWPLLWRATHPPRRGHPPPPRPATPPTLLETVRLIAQLGGFLGRRGDGEPGAAVLWRGLRRLDDLLLGATLVQSSVETLSGRDVGNA
jgi:hypothetical protein